MPQIVPQLLSQTNILLHAHQTPSLVAHEELNADSRPSGVVHSHRSTPSRSQGPYAKSVTFRPSRTPRSPTPPTGIRSALKKPTISKSRSGTPQQEGDDKSDSEVSQTSYNSNTSVHSQLSDNFKIPKPIGEVGRPGSGGYNLNAELALHPRSFKDLKVLCMFSMPYCPLTLECRLQEYVNKLIDLHLNVTICYSKQDEEQIRRVVKAVSNYVSFDLAATNNLF